MSHTPGSAGFCHVQEELDDPGQGLICLTEDERAPFQQSMSTFISCHHTSYPSSNGFDAPEWVFESAHLTLIRRDLVQRCLNQALSPGPVFASTTQAGPSQPLGVDTSDDVPGSGKYASADNPFRPCQNPVSGQSHPFGVGSESLIYYDENPLRPYQSPVSKNKVIFDGGGQACSRCQKRKKLVQSSFSPWQRSDALVKPDERNPFLFLNDFHAKFERPRCCGKCVCTDCWRDSLSSPFHGAWSATSVDKGDLDTWLSCPACNSPLSSQYKDYRNVLQLMKAVDMDDAEFHAGQFEEANRLRSALRSAVFSLALPSQEKQARLLEKSLVLHNVLIEKKLIRPYLRTCRDDAVYPPVQIVPHTSIRTSRPGSSGVVLILEHLFHPCVPRDCDFCAETYLEYDDSEGKLWTEAFRPLGFGIDVWSGMKVLHFPSRAQLSKCRHELGICSSCMSRYIRVETEKGEACVENIKCPHPDCKHHLTEGEIEHLAKPAVLSKYRRLAFLKAVGPMPGNFRQCLKEGCFAGGLYDISAGPFVRAQNPSRYRITCDGCGFAMCYTHQTPWHAGLTCAEFDEQRAHADEWSDAYVANNTKPCPKCAARIEKGDGCFHMTCRHHGCGHQFCWECLADWAPISSLGSRGWEAHREGCIFRSRDVPSPTAIRGVDASRAAARYEERERHYDRLRHMQLLEQVGVPPAVPLRL